MQQIIFLIFILILFLYAVPFLTFKTKRKNNIKECNNIFKECGKLMLKEVAVKNIVIISLVSIKYITQIKNFWISSALPNNYTNILFISSDYQTYRYCKTLTKYVLMGNIIVNQTKDLVAMNEDYSKIIVSKLYLIKAILHYDYSVLVNDLDIYFNKNPIPYLLQYKEDIVASVDGVGAVNTGF